MTITKFVKTVYVFTEKDCAVLKEQQDGTLRVLSSPIGLDELEKFLQDHGYKIA